MYEMEMRVLLRLLSLTPVKVGRGRGVSGWRVSTFRKTEKGAKGPWLEAAS